MEADDEGRRRMEAMYGLKVLNKLVAAWEAQAADREYLRDNTVPPLSTLGTIIPSHFIGIVADDRRRVQHVESPSKKLTDVTK